MGALGGLAKGIIGGFAILLGIIGIAFLAIAGIVAVEFRSYANGSLFSDVYLWGPVGVGIVLGLLLLFIFILGMGGICCEKKGMLKGFAALMTILIILEIAVAVLVYVYRGNLEDELQTGIVNGINKAYNGTMDTNTQKALNSLQEKLKCCGGNGTQDYTSQGIAIPDACCSTGSTCTANYYEDGCTTKVQNLYKRYSNIIFGIAIAFAVLEVLAMIYSCCVLNSDDSKLA